jgi:hypothetical protein
MAFEEMVQHKIAGRKQGTTTADVGLIDQHPKQFG